MNINTNSASMSALRFLRENKQELNLSLERLSTGKKINRGSDGPAAMISAEALSAEIAALDAQSQAFARESRELAIVDGGLSEFSSMTQDLQRATAALANSAGLTEGEREAYQMEVDSLTSQIQRFGEQSISRLESMGVDSATVDAARADLSSALAGLGSITSGGSNQVSMGNAAAAQDLISAVSSAGASLRGAVGSHISNTLEPAIRSNQKGVEELMASRSVIEDTDYAVETSNRNALQVKVESSIKVLKISNDQPKRILDLLNA